MMKIARPHLLENIIEFGKSGHGLVVGKPGVGKSYVLSEMAKTLKSSGVPAFMIRIDKLFEVNQAELNRLFRAENWIDYLASIESAEDIQPLLIFDAFDAAREESKRLSLLRIIKEAKMALSDKWNILVSVRSYDAGKSEELARIFGVSAGDGSYGPARKFYVNELSLVELKDAVREHAFLNTVVEFGNEKLNEVLRVPFYLTLLESISNNGGGDVGEIRQMKSEIELLNKFWRLKAVNKSDGLDYELLIGDFAKELAGKRSLSLSKDAFIRMEHVNAGALRYLESENIINAGTDLGARVYFSHNIFFDYFVSRYALPDDLDQLDAFMKADLSRIFFLRPSFIYLFSNEWFSACDSFWKSYWRFILSDHAGISLFARLSFNTIIASEYSNVNQLKPILSERDVTKRSELIRYLLQAIRFQRENTLKVDVQLYEYLSSSMQVGFVNDLGFLAERAVKVDLGDAELKVLGVVARNFLSYTMDESNGQFKAYFERLAASMGVDLVCRTHASDLETSRESLRRVLALIKADGFEISYISNLTESVKYIIPADPDFAAEIFLAVFDHEELSSDRTQMHASVLMSFTSNRRQDYEMCYYRLETAFPILFQKDSMLSIEVGLTIVNRRIIDKKLKPYQLTPKESSFEYQGIELGYFADNSVVWGENTFDFDEKKFLDVIFDVLSNMLEDTEALHNFIRQYLRWCLSAYSWKRLFAFGADYPKEMKDELLPLLEFKMLVVYPDTSYDVREFVRKVVKYLDDKEIGRIEDVAFEHYADGRDENLAMLLSQIPASRSQSVKAKGFFEKNKRGAVNVKPIEFSTSSEDYSTDIFLKERGVDMEVEVNKELTEWITALEGFNNRNLNNVPLKEDVVDPLSLSVKVFGLIQAEKTSLPAVLFISALRAVAQCCVIVSRLSEKLNETQFESVKEILVFAFNYETDADKKQRASNPMHGFGPTPKNEAAEAIPFLYKRSGAQDDLALLKEAIGDEGVIVRFKSVRYIRDVFADDNYQMFWQLLKDRLEKETNAFVYSLLLANIQLRKENSKEQVEEIFGFIEAKRDALIKDSSFRDNYADILYWLLISHKSVLAKRIMMSAAENVEFCNTIIFKIFEKLHPSHPANNFVDADKVARYKVLIEVMQYYLARVDTILSALPGGQVDFEKPKVKDSFAIINQFILRIYFQLSEQMIGRNSRIRVEVNDDNRRGFYFLIKPLYEDILAISSKLNGGGLMTGPSAHYFTQSLNLVLHYDVSFVLKSVLQITRYAEVTNYTLDPSSLAEIVNMTEKLFADYRYLLQESEPFGELVELLEIFAKAGWVDAMKLLWKLDEVFK